MLLERTPTAAIGDIVSIKLVTGDELVGKLTVSTKDRVSLNRPVIVTIQMTGPQQASLGFAPFMASCPDDGSMTFTTDKLLAEPVKSRPDVASNYLRATTGIELPVKSGLVGF